MSTQEPERNPAANVNDDKPLRFESREPPRFRPKRTELSSQQFNSRGAFIKVGWMILLLMFVVYAMTVSGKPETWHWLVSPEEAGKSGEKQSPDGAAEPEEARVELKSALREHHPEGDDHSPASEGGEATSDAASLPIEADVSTVRDAADLERDFLRAFIMSLDRPRTLAFWQALLHSVKGKELPAGETSTVSGVIEALSREWSRWNENLDRQLSERPFSAEKQEEIRRTRERWETSILPALAAIVVRPDPDADFQALTQFRKTVGDVADSLVEHFAPVSRPVESYAWYSAWERVFEYTVGVSPDELPSPLLNQLLTQPDVWAGKRIYLTGTVLRVQKIKAGPNPLAIESYTLLWVKPDHSTNSPYCVYTLEPPVELAAPESGKIAEVEVPVSIAGQFFKIRLFDAGGRRAEAPVILVPTVGVDVPTTRNAAPTEGTPVAGLSLAWMLGLGAIAAAVAIVAWRSSKGGQHRGSLKGRRLEKAMDTLQKDPAVESVSERLRRLESQAEGLSNADTDKS